MTVRRLKTYTAQTGSVYQYYFVGRRAALPGEPEAPADEYVFDVTAGPIPRFAVSVFLRADALAAWAGAHGRALTAAEQYAAAKLRFIQDLEAVEPSTVAGARRVAVNPENIEELLAELELGE